MKTLECKISIKYREGLEKVFKSEYTIIEQVKFSLASFVYDTGEILINGNVFTQLYSEKEIIVELPRVITHEFFHGLLNMQEGKRTSCAFDNNGFTEKLSKYGVYPNEKCRF